MNDLRIKFSRENKVKFISHLDLMKAFERAIRRSGLPIAYTQGFNPHPMMVFGLPLPVGVTSEAEYADFEMAAEVKPEEFVTRLNTELPDGLRVLDAKPKKSGGNIMALITAAEYEITILLKRVLRSGALSGPDIKYTEVMDERLLADAIKDYLGQDAIIAHKEGKKGAKDINIRPMIRSISGMIPDKKQMSCDQHISAQYACEQYDAAIRLKVLLDAGSVSNLRPELLAGTFSDLLLKKLAGIPEDDSAGADASDAIGAIEAIGASGTTGAIEETRAIDVENEEISTVVRIHRTGLFIGSSGELKDPLDNSAAAV